MSKMPSLPDGSQEKECPIKKPPMYAFCLRPRGLEVPNKLLRQRSHKKFVSTVSHSSYGREQDGFYSSGIYYPFHITLILFPCPFSFFVF